MTAQEYRAARIHLTPRQREWVEWALDPMGYAARNAVKLGCLAAKIAMTDDLAWADALAVAKAGLTDHGPAFAAIYGVTITR